MVIAGLLATSDSVRVRPRRDADSPPHLLHPSEDAMVELLTFSGASLAGANRMCLRLNLDIAVLNEEYC